MLSLVGPDQVSDFNIIFPLSDEEPIRATLDTPEEKRIMDGLNVGDLIRIETLTALRDL